MKITKYLHSCLLVEEQSKTILFDPGIYTFEANVFPPEKINKLDYILITHEHPDHCYLPFIKSLTNNFPNVRIITNASVSALLKKEGVKTAGKLPDFIRINEIPHEKVIGANPPSNIQFTIFNKLSHPGDSYHINNSSAILALPIQAPWGSFTQALGIAVNLKPSFILPVHDWHWKDEARRNFYIRAGEYLKQFNINFCALETGETIKL